MRSLTNMMTVLARAASAVRIRLVSSAEDDTVPGVVASDATEEVTTPMTARSEGVPWYAADEVPGASLHAVVATLRTSVRTLHALLVPSPAERKDRLHARAVNILHDAIDASSDEIARVIGVPVKAGRRTDNGLRPQRERETR